jgi:hypothetical protein
MDAKDLARGERADLADFLATLSPQEWEAPTLCDRWRVREVEGPAEALLMAVAGRRGAAGQLRGPGQPTLAARIGG